MSDKEEKPVCLRCSGPMEVGNLPNAVWIQGERVKLVKYFPPINLPIVDNWVPPDDVEVLETFFIKAFRCTLCGYLEFFANQSTGNLYKAARWQ